MFLPFLYDEEAARVRQQNRRCLVTDAAPGPASSNSEAGASGGPDKTGVGLLPRAGGATFGGGFTVSGRATGRTAGVSIFQRHGASRAASLVVARRHGERLPNELAGRSSATGSRALLSES